jgi:ATP-dependent helicase/nuclease subunit A
VGVEQILGGLNPRQKEAVVTGHNAVVSAGAGSGKTRVIASRYAWLVMEQKIPVEKILTLTFTNKAVNEMYSRVYAILAAQTDDPLAREAVAQFSKANIQTLDSFCAGVARLAAPRYGISPDFICDPDGVRALALQSALPFALNNRDNRGLQVLLGDKKIQTLGEELFAGAVLAAGSIAAPLDFTALRDKQREEIRRVWNTLARDAEEKVEAMLAVMGDIAKPGDQFDEILRQGTSMPPVPDILPLLEERDSSGAARQQIQDYAAFLQKFLRIKFSGKLNHEKEIIRDNRDALGPLEAALESAALFALHSDTVREVFSLMDTYQRDFNRKKREAGLLTFADIARLAVDALSRYPDLRQYYNRSISAIMIDEFQDNNQLQRDLIYLLAEEEQYDEPGVPGFEKLHAGKMIFVGDEKQSIYRFRGADVSVFRNLSETFSRDSGAVHINLDVNYRSRPPLIRAFNYFFGGEIPGGPDRGPAVFLEDGEELPDYEARYEGLEPGLPSEAEPGGAEKAPLCFCFLDPDQIPGDDPDDVSGDDLEAAHIALMIRDLVDQGYQVGTREKGGTGKRRCTFGDMAVLLRTTGHQAVLEKQFRNFGIPYSADDPAGLFSDAPINDLYNFLRLLVYPHDRAAYAAVIRSPLCGLSDLTLTVCMMADGTPFDGELDDRIPPDERGAFIRARDLYRSFMEEARKKTAAELITRLWYDEGYRYETLWSSSTQIYGELFDFFFELARQSDQRGQTLAEFLDAFAQTIRNSERIRELRVPVEREGGVRIMTVHKSKGLEFPVVFVPGCQGKIRMDRNDETAFFSEEWGISLNLPAAEELPGGKAENYFYILQKEDEKKKAIAELRRLLYVAMTRAESRLFLTAVLPPRNKDEREAWEAAKQEPGYCWIPERLAELRNKRETSAALPGFLDLLLPALTGGDGLYALEEIPALSRADLFRRYATSRRVRQPSMAEAAETAAPLYEAAPLVPPPPAPVSGVSASALRYVPAAGDAAAAPGPAVAAPEPDETDALLERAKIDHAEFGTIVHAYLESPAAMGKNLIPLAFLARLDEKDIAALDGAARRMAETFLASDLGRGSLADPGRESEYPILTMVETGSGKIPVNGVIDLLFESDQVMQVVDFKTDRTEDPERHLAQLAVYRRAVLDIFGKPVRAWLYYLRSGNAVELTGDLEKVDIEKTVAASSAGP